ncbi:antibiotic efflux protein [Escherichia coli]|nr:antibiotic efflux protein [Escherichia coli]
MVVAGGIYALQMKGKSGVKLGKVRTSS